MLNRYGEYITYMKLSFRRLNLIPYIIELTCRNAKLSTVKVYIVLKQFKQRKSS